MSRFSPASEKKSTQRFMIGIYGTQGSGKTVSALRVATGLSKKGIAVIDTENCRCLQYKKNFTFDHCDFQPPFRPSSYAELIKEANESGKYDVIIVDSMSHEHEGIGGVLEWHEEILNQMAGSDYKKREACKFTAWIKPKQSRNSLIQVMQRNNCHLILCFRGKEKVKIDKKEGKKTEVSKTGLSPIGGEEFAFEMSILAALPNGSKGIPDWSEKESRINDMSGDLRQIFIDNPQFNEKMGEALYNYSIGTKTYFLRSSKGRKIYADEETWRIAATDMITPLSADHVEKFISLNPQTLSDEYLSKLIKEKKNENAVLHGEENDGRGSEEVALQT